MRTLALAVLASTLLAGCASPGPGTNSGPGTTPDAAGNGPAWTFTDTDGTAHSRETATGKPAVLFFFASWCSVCRHETGILKNVQSAYAAQGVRFYSLAYDGTDDAASVRQWKTQYAQPWPHGLDAGFAVQKTFGVTSQSSLVVLDTHGVAVRKWSYGGAAEADLRAAIDEALSRR
jgi:thiol-disulfide isomerase/thioredoxin